jgi:hypothetical protein
MMVRRRAPTLRSSTGGSAPRFPLASRRARPGQPQGPGLEPAQVSAPVALLLRYGKVCFGRVRGAPGPPFALASARRTLRSAGGFPLTVAKTSPATRKCAFCDLPSASQDKNRLQLLGRGEIVPKFDAGSPAERRSFAGGPNRGLKELSVCVDSCL